MRLKKLTLTNFRGLRSYVFSPQGQNAALLGTNGTGKSTVFDAYTWLLHDRGSAPDSRSFSPKTADASGNELHGVDACVEGCFFLDNGNELTLKKTLHEDWSARRGQSEKVLTGNRTLCAIDGVPVTVSEYERRVAQLCPPDKAQMLTSPLYFATVLHWQDRRRILLELCGDVSDREVFSASPALPELYELLKKPDGSRYAPEEWRSLAAASCKAVQEKLRELPQRLDEVQRSLPKLPQESEEELQRARQEASSRRDRLLQRRSQQDKEEQSRLQTAAEQTAIEQSRAQFERQKNEELATVRRLLAAVTASRQSVQGRQLTLQVLQRGQERELARLIGETDRLKAELAALEKSACEVKSHCPTCSQPLPPESRQRAIQAFERQKSERLEALRAELAKLQPESLTVQTAQTAAELARLQDELAAHTAREGQLSSELSLVEARRFEATEIYAAHERELAKLRACRPDTTDTDRELTALDRELRRLDGLLVNYTISRERQARKSELLREQRQAKQEYERLSRGMELCELFVKTKVSLLTERIHAHFKTVRFRLFERQLNGGIRECCEVLAQTSRGWKLFQDANAGARLCAGLELIDTLSQKWGISLPVFVDNAEAVVKLPRLRPQLIRLLVSAPDTELRTELEAATYGMD